MYDERSLATALAGIGYRRQKHHVYRAEWSSDIEHFIYFAPNRTGYHLSVWFGLRNTAAELFALRSVKRYRGELQQLIRYDDRHDCFMRFPLAFGDFKAWELGSALAVPEMSGPALAQKAKLNIEDKLLPFVRSVTTRERLASLLLADASPVRGFKATARSAPQSSSDYCGIRGCDSRTSGRFSPKLTRSG